MTDSNGTQMYMPVAPAYGMGGGNGGFGFGGDSGAWWLLILLIALGGWGNGFGNNGGGGGFGGGVGNSLYPWLNNSNQINDGFRDQLLNDNITSIRDGVTGISTQLCNGFASVNQGVANGFAQAEIAANARQMADMNQQFAIQSALQNCCCENRAGLADLKYTVATENCQDRTSAYQNTRDIIDSQTRGTQAILDKLCALELDGFKRENDNLRQQLNMATLRESQTAQNAFIQAGLTNEVDALYNRLSNCPVPTVPVYGRQPIFTCPGNNNGCGCGM